MGYSPSDIGELPQARLDGRGLAALRGVASASATASDILDELGWNMAVSSEILAPRASRVPQVVGHAVTLEYVPERRQVAKLTRDPHKLAHEAAFETGQAGDVLVISVLGAPYISSLGGVASALAARSGLSGCVVDGGVRDVGEIAEAGLGVWSRYVTPRTGKWRLEAKAMNRPICCGGVQVRPGDLVIADATGVAFVPLEIVGEVASRVLEVSQQEEDERANIARR